MLICARCSFPSTTASGSLLYWFRKGDRVKQAQLLARLDTARLEPQLAQAEAQAAAQLQVLKRLRSGSRSEEIAQGRPNLQAA